MTDALVYLLAYCFPLLVLMAIAAPDLDLSFRGFHFVNPGSLPLSMVLVVVVGLLLPSWSLLTVYLHNWLIAALGALIYVWFSSRVLPQLRL